MKNKDYLKKVDLAVRKSNDRVYNILVYGIERVRLIPPENDIISHNYKLFFEPFDTKKRFSDFDGVILFQGIFEDYKYEQNMYGIFLNDYVCHKDELDKRCKEIDILIENQGFICFLLCSPFHDSDSTSRNYRKNDLSKIYLNYPSFYRKNYSQRTSWVKSKYNEFNKFLKFFGATNSYFVNLNKNIDLKIIAESGKQITGMILFNRFFFIPSLIPENMPENIEEYFTLLSEAITSTVNKLVFEIPEWINEFKFKKEIKYLTEKSVLQDRINKINDNIELYQRFKRILLLDGEVLVDAVVELFEKGLNLNVNKHDDLKEDIKILNKDNNPIILGEIKGTNRGLKREHINQLDNHRERSDYPPEFPGILIINTHIKNSRNLKEKDKDIPKEQIKHAVKMNILLLRTLDLLRLLRLIDDNCISRDKALKIFKSEVGWLKVESSKYEVLQK
ncbi:MAG: hypothetical protein KAW56_10750 [Candidatus Marinimicrobia bacterium]|nr:hypothetical protein [Candidatus Neomarinimicrobiota bacterium]